MRVLPCINGAYDTVTPIVIAQRKRVPTGDADEGNPAKAPGEEDVIGHNLTPKQLAHHAQRDRETDSQAGLAARAPTRNK